MIYGKIFKAHYNPPNQRCVVKKKCETLRQRKIACVYPKSLLIIIIMCGKKVLIKIQTYIHTVKYIYSPLILIGWCLSLKRKFSTYVCLMNFIWVSFFGGIHTHLFSFIRVYQNSVWILCVPISKLKQKITLKNVY